MPYGYQEISVNNETGDGLLPDSTNPLAKLMKTNHHQGPVTITWGQFNNKCLKHLNVDFISMQEV